MYKLNAFGVTRLSDGASIPADPRNGDYARYLAWVKSGNVPAPADIIFQAATAKDKADKLADLLIAKGVLTQSDIAGLKDAQ